ncbi:hypothetical protein LOTGIDRAFT_159841 [Lottia gigantea]|uniref:Peptidase M14 domain-containing protein n=1 Tax=Lottia gigantea TaxID=225164 RepID=V4ARV7_LOTGI|nr:hypothetical protein LOTGIDRAFT_159841 [Lottia gigantea]ESO96431.1 hypothetical protein LOTGIDRAFT_159841 [Lottia gigantea]
MEIDTMKWQPVLFISTLYWLVGHTLDVNPQHERYLPDYTKYHNLSRIQDHISDLTRNNPSYMSISRRFRSKEGRPQMLLHLTNFSSSQSVPHSYPHTQHVPKIKILLSYGEHAREFMPIETLFYLLQNLTEGIRAPLASFEESFSRTILTKFDIYVIVMANPDGRKIVEKTHNYCWRGTSTGVDLNRNFDWEFGNIGSSSNKKDEEYRGPFPFSEEESVVYTEITGSTDFDVFISFHSGIRHIYLPFADTVSKMSNREPYHIKTMEDLARKLSKSTNHLYKYGKSYELGQYTADGTIFDYMAGKRQIPICLAIELWGKENHQGPSCFDEFNPPNTILQIEVSEILPLYVSMFMFLIQWKEENPDIVFQNEAPSMMFGYILLGVVILLTLFVAVNKRWCRCNKLFPRRRVVSLRSLSSTITVWGFSSKSSWA